MEAKHRMMTEQLRLTHSDDDVAAYLREVIQSDIARDHWKEVFGITEILNTLEKLKQNHNHCDDGFYTCPKHPEGCLDDDAGTECNCGADKHNTEIESLILKFKQLPI